MNNISWGTGFASNEIDEPIYYFNPEQLKEVRKEVYKNPNVEVGLNTFANVQEYAESLDFGIYTFHTRGEVLNTKGWECLEKLEKNASIHAALTNFKLSVVQPGFIVRAADNSEEAALGQSFFEYLLADMDSNLTTIVYDMLSAIVPGYSLSEKVYKTINWRGNKKKSIKAIKTKKAGLYAFFIDAFDNIQAVRSLINYDQALPKEKFIIYSWLAKNGNPYGFPLFDVLYPYFYALNELQKFMIIGAAKHANPSLVIYTENGASDEVIEAVQNFANNITTSSVGTLPKSVEAKILDIANRSGNPYIEMLHYLISEIEKAILLNDLTISQSRDTGTRAETSEKIKHGKQPIIMYARRQIEEVLFEQLVKPLMAYNFNPEKYPVHKYPRIVFNDEEKTDKPQFVENVVKLTQAGYINPIEHGEYIVSTVFPNAPKEDDEYKEMLELPDFRLPAEKAFDELENSTIPDNQLPRENQGDNDASLQPGEQAAFEEI